MTLSTAPHELAVLSSSRGAVASPSPTANEIAAGPPPASTPPLRGCAWGPNPTCGNGRALLVRSCAAAAIAALLVGCSATLESGLTEQQANEVLVALGEAGIGASKSEERSLSGGRTFRVDVTGGNVSAALAVLRERELPHRAPPGIEELLGERGLVPVPSEERARVRAAIAGELARSLESIDGVLSARVHLADHDEGTELLPRAGPERPRASVLVRHRGASVDGATVARLIAGAVPSMVPEDVAVVLIEAPAPRSTPAELVALGPVSVARESYETLRWTLGLLLATNVLLGAALGLALYRMRRG